MSDKKKIAKGIVFCIYLLVSFYILQNHEVWRDEVDVLLMVQSLPVSSFLDYLRYSGHPGLFHVFAKVLTYLGLNLQGIQWSHFLLSSFAIGILYFFSPFSFLLSSSFLFGNYFLYRFPVFVRNYSIGLLFLIITVLWIRSPNKYFRYLSYVSLCLLTQTHALFAILGFAYGLALLLEAMRKPEKRKELAIFLPILFSFGLFFLYCVLPQKDSQFAFGENANPLALRIAISYLFFPIFAESKLNYYGTWFVLIFFCYLFRKDTFCLVTYFVGALGIVLFFRFVYVSHLHHLSVLYSHLLLSSFLYLRDNEKKLESALISGFLYFISFIQILYFIQTESRDLTQEFSGSKSAYKILEDCGWDPSQKLAGYGPDEAKTILIYLPVGSQMYFPSLDRFGNFMRWNREFRESYKLSETVLLDRMESKSIPFAVWNRPLSDTTNWNLCGANSFLNVIDINEIFYIYKHK